MNMLLLFLFISHCVVVLKAKSVSWMSLLISDIRLIDRLPTCKAVHARVNGWAKLVGLCVPLCMHFQLNSCCWTSEFKCAVILSSDLEPWNNVWNVFVVLVSWNLLVVLVQCTCCASIMYLLCYCHVLALLVLCTCSASTMYLYC